MFKKLINAVFSGLIITVIVILGLRTMDWRNVNWGKVQLSQAETITVTGEAKGQQKSELARFTATVKKINDDKQTAVNEVNQHMETLIKQIKAFGISESDIKTQTINIYQQEEQYYEGDRRKTRPGQWRVSNTLEITLRDTSQTSQLTDLLAKSGATNVYGPNFYVDETTSLEANLMEEAIKNAREKAEKIAQGANKELGEIINVTEEGATKQGPIPLAGGGGGAATKPGTSTVSKKVTVVFGLK